MINLFPTNISSKSFNKISAWSLIKPYWISKERKIAWILLITIIIMHIILVGISVSLNSWNRDFYNALQNKNSNEFPYLMFIFAVLACTFITITVYAKYLRHMLAFLWRQWLTTEYLEKWLENNIFYKIERDRLTDNPDQRIAIDLDSFASTTLSLSIDFISTITTFIWFSIVLWIVAGALSVLIGNFSIKIPGYMLVVATFYAVIGSLMTHKVGYPLVSINYKQQRVEADFRFGLIRLRENAEQIAFYNGMKTEILSIQDLFNHIRKNWWKVIKYTKRYHFIVNLYGQLVTIFPIIVASPRYFEGAINFGMLMQISGAFGSVSESLSWFINSYGTIVEWRATINRLRDFKCIIEKAKTKSYISIINEKSNKIKIQKTNENQLSTNNLILSLPNGQNLSKIKDITIKLGSRWLIRGKSGSGKSTLLRALAGIWPFGSGYINLPKNALMMFIPQQSYLPFGTIKSALSYPSIENTFCDNECNKVLSICQLSNYINNLHISRNWMRILSPGEQQRLIAARLILHKPNYIFLDESTSALDNQSETHFYYILINHIPQSTIISVAHLESSALCHNEILYINRIFKNNK